MDKSLQSLDQVKASALDMAVRFGPKLFTAIVILVIGYFVGGWAGRMLDRLLLRLELEASLRVLLVRLLRILVLALFTIVALQNLGIELLPLVAGIGVAGAGVALAMQGTLGNGAAGLTIIFTRPFHVGDYISIAHEEGEVLDISIFSTTLGHADLSKVVIPNRKIVGDPAQLRPDPAARYQGGYCVQRRCRHCPEPGLGDPARASPHSPGSGPRVRGDAGCSVVGHRQCRALGRGTRLRNGDQRSQQDDTRCVSRPEHRDRRTAA